MILLAGNFYVLLTLYSKMWNVGLADGRTRKIKLKRIPRRSPISTLIKVQIKNVPIAATASISARILDILSRVKAYGDSIDTD